MQGCCFRLMAEDAPSASRPCPVPTPFRTILQPYGVFKTILEHVYLPTPYFLFFGRGGRRWQRAHRQRRNKKTFHLIPQVLLQPE